MGRSRKVGTTYNKLLHNFSSIRIQGDVGHRLGQVLPLNLYLLTTSRIYFDLFKKNSIFKKWEDQKGQNEVFGPEKVDF